MLDLIYMVPLLINTYSNGISSRAILEPDKQTRILKLHPGRRMDVLGSCPWGHKIHYNHDTIPYQSTKRPPEKRLLIQWATAHSGEDGKRKAPAIS